MTDQEDTQRFVARLIEDTSSLKIRWEAGHGIPDLRMTDLSSDITVQLRKTESGELILYVNGIHLYESYPRPLAELWRAIETERMSRTRIQKFIEEY